MCPLIWQTYMWGFAPCISLCDQLQYFTPSWVIWIVMSTSCPYSHNHIAPKLMSVHLCWSLISSTDLEALHSSLLWSSHVLLLLFPFLHCWMYPALFKGSVIQCPCDPKLGPCRCWPHKGCVKVWALALVQWPLWVSPWFIWGWFKVGSATGRQSTLDPPLAFEWGWIGIHQITYKAPSELLSVLKWECHFHCFNYEYGHYNI
jgi:hypothetical protein